MPRFFFCPANFFHDITQIIVTMFGAIFDLYYYAREYYILGYAFIVKFTMWIWQTFSRFYLISIFFKCERTKYDKENDSKRIDWNSPGIFVIACDQSGCWEQFHCQCDQGNSDEKWHWNRFEFHISFCNNNMTSVEFFPYSKLEKSICTDSKWTGIVSVFQSHAMQTTIKKLMFATYVRQFHIWCNMTLDLFLHISCD